MTRVRVWVVGLGCWAVAGCGGVSLSGDAGHDAARGDGGVDAFVDLPAETSTDAPAVETSDGPPAADRADAADAKDALVVKDAGFSDAPMCPTESDHGALVPSTACAVAAVTTAATCAGAAACPVGAMFQLSCTGGGYGPWIVPTSAGGAVMFVTNSGSFVTRLFTMGPGATARVDDVPGLTSAANALAVDTDGNPTIFAGEMPGIWRVRKTALGWRREVALETGGPLALVTDGRARDATKAAVAFFGLNDQSPRLATRDGSCWHSEILPGTRATYMGMDVDAMNRAWVAWYGYQNAAMPAVDLAGPDGLHRVWTSALSGGLNLHDHPIVLAGGLTGTAAYPTVAIQRGDGVHVLHAPAATPTWSDRMVPGSATGTRGGNCPMNTLSGCGGLTTCTSTTNGALPGFGIARTTTGRVYAAWLAGEGESSYTLSQSGTTGFCPAAAPAPVPPGGVGVAPPLCTCTQTLTSSRGSVSIVIARVDLATPVEALRVQMDAGAEPRGNGLELTARGNTLLVVASAGTSIDTRLRYLEIDTTQLP